MRRSEKALIVSKTLNELYPTVSIPLTHRDPFTLLIAVLLSAQCTDERVNKVTPLLFSKASTPEKMIELSLEEIKDLIRPCGCFQKKSEAIWQLSKLLIERHKGKVPDNFDALEALPGVGHKTASVVMSQAFNVPAFPVDTHIHRCAKRWGLTNGKTVVQTEHDLKKLFPMNEWGSLHLKIIYYARQYCKARGHLEANCPICFEIHNSKRR